MESAEWYFLDNGFSSQEEMDRSHEPIVEAAVKTLASESGKVVDFGCGNGILLQKICATNSSLIPFGNDIDQARIGHAQIILPEYADNFEVGGMFNPSLKLLDQHFGLAILMPGRLLETDEESAADFRQWLKKHCTKILVYAYGDWLEKYGSLRELAHNAGFIISGNADRAGLVTAILN